MENTHPTDANKMIEQMQMIKFGGVFNAALNMMKKEPVLLIALFLAPMVVDWVLQSYVYPPIYSATYSSGPIVYTILMIIFGIISALISFFGAGLLLRAASQVYDGKKVDVNATITFVKNHFVDAVKLAINLFIYTGGWIVIAYFLAAAVLAAIAPAIGLLLFGLSWIAIILYVILFFKKIVDASMAYAVFWSDEKPDSQGALKRSLELCAGLTWTIFGNYFLMGLVGAIVSAVLISILGAILAALGTTAVALATVLASGLVGTFYATFQYSLKGQVEKFRGSSHAHHAA